MTKYKRNMFDNQAGYLNRHGYYLFRGDDVLFCKFKYVNLS